MTAAESKSEVRPDATFASQRFVSRSAPAEEGWWFKLPFDPMRMLRAVWVGRWRSVLGALLGLALSLGLAMWKAQTRYEVSMQLLKRYASPTIQEGLNGEPYKPSQFTNSELASAASSEKVLEAVSQKASPPVSVNELKNAIKVAEDKTSDSVKLTLSGYTSAAATVDLSSLWGDEIINFIRGMQAEESRDIRKVIQTQLDNNEVEIQQLDEEITNLMGSSGAPDLQVDSFLRSESDVEEKYNQTKLEYDSVNTEDEGLRSELQRQTPAAEQLREAKTELEQLQTRYTDQNPLVLDQQEKVAGLEQEVKKESGQPAGDVSDMASTYVGNQLYLTMVQMEEKRGALKQQLDELDKQRQLYAKSPEKMSELMQHLRKKETLQTGQSLLLSRMQEARIYEQDAPASYGLFAPADLDHVLEISKTLKCIVLSILGAFTGGCMALAAVMVVGVADRKLRTAREAQTAVEAPLFASIPHPVSEANADVTAAGVWARWHSATASGKPMFRAVWTPAPHESESDFWRMMLAQARVLLPALMVVDCGREPLREIADLPQVSLEKTAAGFCAARFPMHGASLADRQKVQQYFEKAVACGVEVWVRLDGEVSEPGVGLMRAAEVPLVLAVLHTEPASFYRAQAARLRHSQVNPCGVIALNDNGLSARD